MFTPDYIQTSSNKYQNHDNQVDRNSPQPSGGLLGSLGKMFSSGKKWSLFLKKCTYIKPRFISIWNLWIHMKFMKTCASISIYFAHCMILFNYCEKSSKEWEKKFEEAWKNSQWKSRIPDIS